MITDAMAVAALKVLREAPEINLKWMRVALEAVEAAAWQPIETAPKDGTSVLAYDPIAEAQALIRWEDGGWVEIWFLTPNPDCTHWRPLPDPPKEKS